MTNPSKECSNCRHGLCNYCRYCHNSTDCALSEKPSGGCFDQLLSQPLMISNSSKKCSDPNCSHNKYGRNPDKPCSIRWEPPVDAPQEEWVERFDALEVTYKLPDDKLITEPLLLNDEQEIVLKSFIRRLLEQQKPNNRVMYTRGYEEGYQAGQDAKIDSDSLERDSVMFEKGKAAENLRLGKVTADAIEQSKQGWIDEGRRAGLLEAIEEARSIQISQLGRKTVDPLADLTTKLEAKLNDKK